MKMFSPVLFSFFSSEQDRGKLFHSVNITIVLCFRGVGFESLKWFPCGFRALVISIHLAGFLVREGEKSFVSHCQKLHGFLLLHNNSHI